MSRPKPSPPAHYTSADHLAANYDEALAGNLPIPDLLTSQDGTRVTHARQWVEKRRPELLDLFAREMYGKTVAPRPAALVAEQATADSVLDGLGLMTQATVRYGSGADQTAQVMTILPAGARQPAPVFIALNFGGNQEVAHWPAIHLPSSWFADNPQNGYIQGRATEASRGVHARRWPLEAILRRGYGVATAYYGDFDPDFDDGFRNGVHPLGTAEGGSTADDEWGAIGAWAWGMSLLADYLAPLPQVDATRLIGLGHSRLGKAALWAGAQDERFAIVIANNSGCAGAALSRRNFGESLARINRVFPHWFCRNFHKYGGNEAALPFDQHALIALMAPRPVYIASATEDLWADPQGEFLSARLASPAYALFGKRGLELDKPPPPDVSAGDAIGTHRRSGRHDILRFDWERYMDFADRHFASRR